MVFHDSRWQEFPDTWRSTGAYIVIYQGGPIYHCTHVPGSVAKWISESEYNAAFTAGMAAACFIIINNDFPKNDADVVP